MELSSKYPVLLLPVKLETRFVTIKRSNAENRRELWVRIIPDQPFLSDFNPTLTKEELIDRESFLKDTSIDRWKNLVEKYGQYRAAWLFHVTPESVSEQPDNSPEENEAEYYFRWLPKHFKLFLFWKENNELRQREHDLKPVADPQGLPFFNNADEWFFDFDKALEKGLATKIDLQKIPGNEGSGYIDQFERIIAVGINREEEDPSSSYIHQLIRYHQFSEGFSFVDYGTPTNNLKGEDSGYSSHEWFDYEGSYSYVVEKSKPKKDPHTSNDNDTELEDWASKYPLSHQNHAEKFSKALGFNLSDFEHVKNADGHDSRLSKLIRKASWFATGGQMLQMLFGDNISNEAHEQIWRFYTEYVDPKGPLPIIRLGKLPYGILPVVHLRDILTPQNQEKAIPNGSTHDKINLALVKLFENWLEMAKAKRPADQEQLSNAKQEEINYVPRMTDIEDSKVSWETELGRILSMQPNSISFFIRMMELERTPAWFSNLVNTPQSIHSYPPQIVDDLLKGKSEYNTDPQDDKRIPSDSLNLFKDFFQDPKDFSESLKNAPVLNFLNLDIPPQNLESIKDPQNPEKQLLTLTFDDDWHIEYRSFIKELRDETRDSLVWYKGDISVLLDLLLRGYANAVHLYYRDVYYYPDKEALENVETHHFKPAKSENEKVNKRGEKLGEVIITYNNGTSKKIDIEAPLEGVIEKVFYKDSATPIGNDRRLFRIKNEEAYTRVKDEMIALGAQIILEVENLIKDKKLDHIKVQEQAISEAFDLNTFRLDAWLTGIASQRIDWLRNGFPEGEDSENSESKPTGFYIGAYGWVENLKKNKFEVVFDTSKKKFLEKGSEGGHDFYDSEGGIIHCPTSAQAVASAMFRQSFATYQPKKSENLPANGEVPLGNPFTINLTSDRIQKSKQFMEGIRQGQEIGALLGYQFEHLLHENGKGNLIYPLRIEYPLKVNKLEVVTGEGREVKGLPNLTVVNGLALLDPKNANDSLLGGVKEEIKKIADILDGSADLLFYEAGYQMTQGNFSQASAAMDAAKGIIEPPKLESIKSRYYGSTVVHKLAMVFESPEEPLSEPGQNPKAFLEPTLEKWLSEVLGGFESIACSVDLFDSNEQKLGETFTVSLLELGIGALDFLQLSFTPLNNDASELEQRIMEVVEQKYSDSLPKDFRYEIKEPVEGESLHNAIEILRSVQALLRESQYLKAEDLASDQEVNKVDEETKRNQIEHDPTYLKDVLERLNKCIKQLKDPGITLETLARYDVQNAKGALFYSDKEAALKRSKKEVQKIVDRVETKIEQFKEDNPEKSYDMKVKELQEIARKLFGNSFYLIPPIKTTPAFRTAIQSDQTALVGEEGKALGESGITGGQERIRDWISGRAEVDVQVEAFDDFLMDGEIWQGNINEESIINPYLEKWNFKVAQHLPPKVTSLPWVALDRKEMSTIDSSLEEVEYPDNAQAIVVYAPTKTEWESDKQYGLLIDHFPEFIPRKNVDTGLAFEYNAPNNEPPHSFLLAASLDDIYWDEDKLKDIVFDTLDLAKVRMVDLDALDDFGNVLPMINWFHIPNLL